MGGGGEIILQGKLRHREGEFSKLMYLVFALVQNICIRGS